MGSSGRAGAPEGLLGVLRTEKWGSQHHQHFQMGVVEALLHRHEAAADDLRTAIRLYLADGRDWCAACVARAEALLDALTGGRADALLATWYEANKRAHRVR